MQRLLSRRETGAALSPCTPSGASPLLTISPPAAAGRINKMLPERRLLPEHGKGHHQDRVDVGFVRHDLRTDKRAWTQDTLLSP